jgi:hypothetical protein
VCVLLGALTATAAAQNTRKYEVTVTPDKSANFAALKTYAWTRGTPAIDKKVDQEIVAAVDHELAGLGLTKQAAASADMLVSYAAQQRTDVDLKSKPDAAGVSKQYAVGTLVVVLLDPKKSDRRLLTARADKPLDAEPAKVQALINEVVAEMFAKYPTRQSAR